MTLPIHNELMGRHRLFNVVSCLGQSCPCTRSIKANDMLHYLKSEVDELHHELDIIKSDDICYWRCYSDKRKKAMASELGDILFDVLMLEMIMRRDYGISIDEAWQVAAEKIERRTPYMKEWGDGISNAKSVEDAERIWKAVKEREKAEKLEKVDDKYLYADPIEKQPFGVHMTMKAFGWLCIKGRNIWSQHNIKCHGELLVGAVFGYFFSHFWKNFHHR